MKPLSLFVLAGLTAGFAGCTQESTPGGPGVTKTTPATPDSRNAVGERPAVTNKSNTFTLAVPSMNTDVDRGKKEDVTISINRGKEFTQTVKLQFHAPKGLMVQPAEPVIQPGKDKVTVSVQATKDAPAGKSEIEVIAVPESGTTVSLQMPVRVKEARSS